MGRGHSIKGELRKFKRSVNKEFPVERLILFGSTSSGRLGKGSDIDLIIVSKKFKHLNFIRRAARMYDHWHLRYPVDFICYTPKEFGERAKRITIVREALEKGTAI